MKKDDRIAFVTELRFLAENDGRNMVAEAADLLEKAWAALEEIADRDVMVAVGRTTPEGTEFTRKTWGGKCGAIALAALQEETGP